MRPSTPSRPLLHLALLLATLASTAWTYALQGDGVVGAEAAAFALSLVTILGTHELGHYVAARAHRVDATLPYFIPLPGLGFGTLGAVIRVKSRIPHRDALVDLGASGPLAGLAVAIPVLLYGLAHSQVVDAVPATAGRHLFEPMSLLGLLAEGWRWLAELWGLVAPAPEGPAPTQQLLVFGDSPLMLALRYLALGPLPEGKDVLMHPLVMAGWIGLLVTLLNLMPVGQLDGGHVAYALWGERARAVGQVAAGVMLLLTLFASVSWGLWLVVTSRFIGFGHPPVVVQGPLSRGRKWVAALCALALVGCALPVPLRVVLQ